MKDFDEFELIGPDGKRYRLHKVEDASSPTGLTREIKPEDIGAHIVKLRKAKGWSQKELGDAAGGLTQATISKVENNAVKAHPTTLKAIFAALEKPKNPPLPKLASSDGNTEKGEPEAKDAKEDPVLKAIIEALTKPREALFPKTGKS